MKTAPQETSEHVTGEAPAVDEMGLHPARQEIPDDELSRTAEEPGREWREQANKDLSDGGIL